MPTSRRARSRPVIQRLASHDRLNFVLTNRIPRALATRFVGWLSRVEQPTVRDLSMWTWQRFAGPIDLTDAATTRFRSVHDCFTRALAPGARPVDPAPDVLVSPCDALVGCCGTVVGTEVLQAKGSAYSIADLLVDPRLVAPLRDGRYVTLRLTSTMYHRFHAPGDAWIDEVVYVPGDVWNVNPPALQRIGRLFCRNERAVLPMRIDGTGQTLTLVCVGAILVASIRLAFLDVTLNLRHTGPNRFPCRHRVRKGEELGHFQHGSTIIALAPPGFALASGVREGDPIRMGEPLFRRDSATSVARAADDAATAG